MATICVLFERATKNASCDSILPSRCPLFEEQERSMAELTGWRWMGLQADTDLLSDRRTRMEEWHAWMDGKKEWAEKQASASHQIILSRYPQADEPDTYTTEQVRISFQSTHCLCVGVHACIYCSCSGKGDGIAFHSQLKTMVLFSCVGGSGGGCEPLRRSVARMILFLLHLW